MCDIIAFDADDTLWHNETLFSVTQEKFQNLLSPYRRSNWTGQELYETEIRNLRYFGYGIKGFTLSMIETAIDLTDGGIQGREIQTIIDFAKEMLTIPVQLLDNVAEVVATLAETHTLMIITKGDLFDQETKIAQSSLAEYFKHIEIVRDKTTDTYRSLFAKYGIDPQRFLMVGNSLRSDILPVVELGGNAVYIPYHITWAHEVVNGHEIGQQGYIELEHIGQLLGVIEQYYDGIVTTKHR